MVRIENLPGIAFSGFVGIGIYQTSAEILAASGPVGALLAYIFAALVAFSVLRCLAEMASVRPVTGALMDFPEKFVDEALGFAVGIMYWWVAGVRLNICLLTVDKRLANCMSMVTLTIASVMFTQFWHSSLTIASATFIMLLVLFLMNACGVRVSVCNIFKRMFLLRSADIRQFGVGI